VGQVGQPGRIPLASQDGVDDPQPRESRDVGDRMVQMDIHLVHRLLHVQRRLRGGLDQGVAVP
jgi:hypothetical protein